MSQSTPQNGFEDGSNRRRSERTTVPVAGRLMLPSEEEHHCDVGDISEVGIALLCKAEAQVGDRIIVYLDNLGRFEGTVVRHLDGGFAIETQLKGNQRERLVERIEFLRNKTAISEHRTFPRQVTNLEKGNGATLMTTEDNVDVEVKVLDISLTGAHLQLDKRPKIGSHVTVGKTLGRVVRHTSEGIGVEFVIASNPAT